MESFARVRDMPGVGMAVVRVGGKRRRRMGDEGWETNADGANLFIRKGEKRG